jgi:hypothetical protein
MSKEKKQTQNVSIPIETHKILVAHVDKIDGKIYKFVEKAIKEKIEREAKCQNL